MSRVAEPGKLSEERWREIREEARQTITPPPMRQVWQGASLWPFPRSKFQLKPKP